MPSLVALSNMYIVVSEDHIHLKSKKTANKTKTETLGEMIDIKARDKKKESY